ncbi:MAG: hypothetical protein AAF558_00100 [Verrucomicrobiota bacterium]
MRPEFELEQVRGYISYLQSNPGQVSETSESHLFPVLQRIFFREGFEVRNDAEVRGVRFPFLLVDLDLKKSPTAVDFGLGTQEEGSFLPEFALEWSEKFRSGTYEESLLVLRNHPLAIAHSNHMKGSVSERFAQTGIRFDSELAEVQWDPNYSRNFSDSTTFSDPSPFWLRRRRTESDTTNDEIAVGDYYIPYGAQQMLELRTSGDSSTIYVFVTPSLFSETSQALNARSYGEGLHTAIA